MNRDMLVEAIWEELDDDALGHGVLVMLDTTHLEDQTPLVSLHIQHNALTQAAAISVLKMAVTSVEEGHEL